MSQFDALQKQLNQERFNAAQYDAFAAALSASNWPGFSAYFEKQAEQERGHFGKFRDYLIDRNQIPALDAIKAPIPRLSWRLKNWRKASMMDKRKIGLFGP
jgi:ferritin